MVVTSEASNLVICSSKKYPYPPRAKEGNGNSEGRGFRKEALSEGVGVPYRGFFPGGLSIACERQTFSSLIAAE